MAQVVQILGALMVLAGFAGLQLGKISAVSRVYLGLNLVGSAVLAGLAWHEEQWGFLLLEGVWAIVSVWSLAQVLRGRPPTIAH